jgi:Animal haem peroxidase
MIVRLGGILGGLSGVFRGATTLVDRTIGWDRLPTPAGLVVLIGLRDELRRDNLHDTSEPAGENLPPLEAPSPAHLTQRTVDGSYNDLDQPRMGMAGSRFGRNISVSKTRPQGPPEILEPSPREVSRALLTRDEFVPASSVSTLVAAWIQFMIRDWFSHGRSLEHDPWEIPLAADDSWPGGGPLRIFRTRPDPTRPPAPSDVPPTYVNTLSHWWDASQIYGTTREHLSDVRTGAGGKLRLSPDGTAPFAALADGDPTQEPGFWLGLAMLQTLFTLEHNAICDMLAAAYPSWTDEELFQRARLILAALLAKIHTVEWTPAVIDHRTTRFAMRANWWGIAGEQVQRVVGRLSGSELVSGIPGATTQHFGVPYSLTEEFVAVYRMHPLIPDHWRFHSVADGRELHACTFRELTGHRAIDLLEKFSLPDLFYSFGIAHPGLVTLHNFPRFLQEFERPKGGLMDLAATDILRTRELGVPRYNEFRRLLRLAPARDFDALTDNPEWAAQMRRVYGEDIEQVDLMVGMFAERRPAGFAFSDTAFRIFILMASRRLNSDRFLTRDYRPEVYTREGMEWIAENTMVTVLLRHYPELRPALRGLDNAFAAWPHVA